VAVRVSLVLLVTAASFVVTATAVSVGASTTRTYVALGDSYTADPGVSGQAKGISAQCNQSAADYPHLVAGAEEFDATDVSCSGAASSDMTSAQHSGVAPQFAALSPSTDVVTLGIGGNDNDLFVRALVSCSVSDALDVVDIGSPCKLLFGNRFADAVASDAASVGQVIGGIHERAPGATVFVVGYPDILPQHGRCYPAMLLTAGDVSYLNGLEQDLNAMLQSEATAHGATYVDTFTPSIGHDVCAPGDARWVNPLIDHGTGLAVHPTPAGVAETATLVEQAMSAKGL
jgi:hypothetical protein